ncbi:MAG: hypothetical protein JW795_19945 [Chitinivibrionales bacterium]|nr:hypothetical protein [Chitinivibrionales bacterium]
MSYGGMNFEEELFDGFCDFCGREDGHESDCIYLETYDEAPEDIVEN